MRAIPVRAGLCLVLLGASGACATTKDGSDPERSSGGTPGGAGRAGGSSGSAGSLGGATSGRAGVGGAAGTGGTLGSAGAGSGGTLAVGGAAGGTGGTLGGVGGAPAGSGGAAAGAASTAGANAGGSAGRGGVAGAAGNPGGTSGSAGTAGTAGAGGAPLGCDNSGFVICEDFEGLAEGAVPSGWTKNGSVGAALDQFHRGTGSLKVGAAENGARRMSLTGAQLTTLGGTHWGRVFYKVRTPAPRPASGVLHSTLVAGSAQSPVSGTIEVRVVDTVEDAQGNHQYLYNVQPDGRGEFGRGSTYDYQYDGDWHCTEWYLDHATQAYRFFVDGAEIPQIAVANGANNFNESEIPAVFTSLSVGWNNYQSAPDGGFVAWLDDLALGPQRIGCN